MNYTAEINVMPLKALLDPQGKAVTNTLHNIDFKSVADVRIGKHITVKLEAADKKNAEEMVAEMCKKILTNPIMEYYEFSINEL